MQKRKLIDKDVERLQLTPKPKRVVQCFLEIECESGFDRTPQQAKSLRKTILQEVAWAIENLMFYDYEEKRAVPLWHKLFIAAQDYEGRGKQLRYLLRCLGRLLKNCDNRKAI